MLGVRASASVAVISVLVTETCSLAGPSAQYRVTFTATWSTQTHPNSIPSGPHFSPLIGGTHNANVIFWQLGSPPSPGIERMAEAGSPTLLRDEVLAAISSGDAYSVIQGGGISPSPGSVSTTFEISATHPFVSLVSMVAPSPDWFVGIHDVSFLREGRWIGQLSFDLPPYDAGGDDGANFTSPDIDVNPKKPISLLTGYPFTNTPPLGTFTFQRILPAPPGDLDRDGDVDSADFEAFQGCTSGPGILQNNLQCADARLDADEDVDQSDFGLFQRCLSCPIMAADLSCAN